MNSYLLRRWAKNLLAQSRANRRPLNRSAYSKLALTQLESREVLSGLPPTATAIPRQVVNEDAAAITLDLSTYFSDPETDPLTYSVVQTNTSGLISPTIDAGKLSLSFAENKFGYSYFQVTANDGTGSTTAAFEVIVREVDDLLSDTTSGRTDAAFDINVVGNDGTGDSIRLVEAGNLQVVQNDTGNATTSVAVTFPQSTPDMRVREGSNRGDYNVQIGTNGTNDVTDGLLFTTVSETGRDNGETVGVEYVTSAIAAGGNGGAAASDYFIPLHSSSPGSEYNTNIGVTYFTYAQGWLAGWVVNSAGTNGGANNLIRTATPNAGITNGTTNSTVIQDLAGGKTIIRLPGINSQSDGLVFAIHGKNEDNYAMAQALSDGSWELTVRDNGSSGTSSTGGNEEDPVAFVYIPRNAPNIVSGRILGDGSTQLSSGNFTLNKTGVGTYLLTIPGQSPTTGTLMLSPENGNSTTADNIVMFQASGNSWEIQTRDIVSGDPVLEDVGDTIPFASFAFIPFLNQPSLRITGLQSADATPVTNRSNLGATLSINTDGTIKYDPLTSTTIQALAPLSAATDTFTYTTTTLTGQTSTATVTVNLTAPGSNTRFYVDDAWASLNAGDSITDADPVASGNQSGTFGTNAFASISAAIAAAASGQKIIINAGTYPESVVITKPLEFIFQGDVTVNSLTDDATPMTTSLIRLEESSTLTLGNSGNQTLSNVITGNGSIKKVGTGTLTLNRVNSYAGATTIDAGAIQAGIANAIPAGSNVALASATELRLNGFNQSIGKLSGSGTVTNNSATAATLTVNSDEDSLFSGILSQPNGTFSLVKNGTGVLELSGSNTLAGTITLNAGTVRVGAAGAVANASEIVVNTNATLSLNGFAFNATSTTLSGSGTVSNGGATDSVLTVTGASDVTIATALTDGTGEGKLVVLKTGTGTLNLNAASTFSGGTTLSQGTLRTNANTGLGTGTVTLGDANTGNNNLAFLASSNGITFANPFIVSSSGTGSVTIGTADGITGAVNTQWNGTLTLNRNVILRAGSADRTTFAGLITGAGGITVTASSPSNRVALAQGTATLNDFTGNITVESGTLQVGVASATANQFIPDSANVTVNAGATMWLSGTNNGTEAINALLGSGTVNNTQGTGYTLVLGAGGGSGDFSGTFGSALTGFRVVKEGAGTQTITGASTAAVATEVNSGTLLVNNTTGSALGSGTVTIGGQGRFGGTGAIGGAVTASGGQVVPGGVGATADLSTGNLTVPSGSTLTVDLNGVTAGTEYDQINVTGSVTLGGTLGIIAGSGLKVGDSFTIITNDGTDAVTEVFANATSLAAVNDPLITFTVSTTGGDGNDVVVTVAGATTSAKLDIVNGNAVYSTSSNVNSNITATETGGTLSLADAAGPITLTTAATAAGWSVDGSGVASGPASSVTGFFLNLGNGTDTLTAVSIGAENLEVSGTGTLNVAGATQTTGNIRATAFETIAIENTLSGADVTVTGVGTITATAAGKIAGTTVSVASNKGIGTSTNRLNTSATNLNLTSDGAVFVTEADGASLTGTTTGAASLDVANLAGTLKVAGVTKTTLGNIALSSADGVAIDANLSSGSGAITITANTDGAGSEGYTQATAATVTTANNSASAFNLTVNTTSGGTGNAALGLANIGGASTGRATVTVHNGSILWDQTQPSTEDSGNNDLTFNAGEYVFTTTGTGSIGTALAPFQSGNLNNTIANSLTLSAGSGGISWVDWDAPDLTVNSASATGGNIRIVAGNAGGHDLVILGNVANSGTGSIYLGSNDNITFGPGVTVGNSTGYSGEILISGNRDKGTAGQSVGMDKTSSVITGNTGANAVRVEIFGDAGTQSLIALSNITAGNGGTITIDTVPESTTAEAGRIAMTAASNVLNAGVDGTIVLRGGNTGAGSTDTFGTAILPIRISGGSVQVISTKNANAFVTAADTAKFQAAPVVSGGTGGNLTFATEKGNLTISGPVVTTGGKVNLTGAESTVIAAQLGDASTGVVTITGNASVAPNAAFLPLTNTTVTGTTTVPSKATLSPSDTATGTFTANGLQAAGGTIAIDLNGMTPGTQYDQIILASGAADLTGATLALTTSNALALNDTFTLISNATGTAVTGMFASGTTVNSVNNPTQQFTVNYAGGTSGKDVVLTLSKIISGNVLNVSNNKLSYGAQAGADNTITVNLNGTNYEITDTSGAITLSSLATAAGWTGDGTNTVTGPSSSVNQLLFNTGDGKDTITLTDLDDPFTLTGGGQAEDTVAINGVLTFTGNASITGVNTITGSTGSLIETTAGNVELVAATGIGTASNRVLTKAATITATAGGGGIFLTEADGADVTVAASGAGAVDIVNTTGTLNVLGATSDTGNMSIASGDALNIGTNLDAGSGTITLAANTDGAGSTGYEQNGFRLTTTNTTADALRLTVNTASGGTGNAAIGLATIGSNTGGTATITTHAGSAVWTDALGALTASQVGLTNGGSNANTFRAFTTTFASTGTGGAGTTERPIQIDNFGVNSAASTPANLTASTGSGGVYVTGWDSSGSLDLSTGEITVTGAGGIRIVAANAGGHNLWVTGNVAAESGNVFLAADDNLVIGAGVVIGGDLFDGTVWIESNRDAGTAGQPLTMSDTSSIVTSNKTNVDTTTRDQTTQAVMLRSNGDAGTPSTITLGDIVVGTGGRLVVNAIPNGIAAEAGQILMASGTNTLRASGGVIDLTAGITAAAVADAIGTTGNPINITTGTVLFNSNNGNVNFASEGTLVASGKVTALGTQTAPATVTLLSQNKVNVIGDLNTANNGIINITANQSTVTVGAGGTLGSSTTGPINITGPLTGTGNISLGGGDLTVDQSATSTFSGAITNGSTPRGIVKNGLGSLTLSGTNSYTGTTTINDGTLIAGSTAALGTSSAVSIADAAGAILNLNNFNTTIGSLVGGGTTGGKLLLGTATLTTGSDNKDTSFGGAISGTGNLIKEGTGIQTLTGTNTYTGTTTVTGGTLRVNGSVAAGSAVTVGTNGTLDGTGKVNGPITASGTLAIGNGTAAGELSTGNITFGTDGVLLIDLLGKTAVTEFDRLNVTGTVNLTGAKLDLNAGFAATVGDSFVVLANDGTDAVVGTFDNLAEGGEITVGTQLFKVSYQGGDGNDVVLTRASALPAPTLSSVTINSTGNAPSATTTYSKINSLVLTFNTAVTIDAGAFSLSNGTNTLTSAANGGILVQVSGNVVTLTFSSTASGVEFGSLADGIWSLTTDLTKVKNGVNAAGTGSATTNNIRRLYGDVNGDGTVDSEDFAAFGNSWGLTSEDAGYQATLDYDGSDSIDSDDFAAFGNRWGISLD